ncbi:MAG: DUF2807 domain-containing protein [Muribaculaceae bacterium]|nr:DUF2807 domain-containing protein [Muribaculaceae bacterium]
MQTKSLIENQKCRLRRLLSLAIAFSIGCTLTSSAAEDHHKEDDSSLKEYHFEVGNFSNLSIQNNVNVVYTHCKDTIGHVRYKSEPDFEDAFIFTNNKGSLKIQVQTDDVGKPGLPTIYVSSTNLEKIDNYSDFNVRVEDNVKADTFSCSLIGNGSITVSDINATNVNAKITAGMGTIILSGECTNADFKLTGTGTIQANMLKASNINCKILGGGSISTYPLRTLEVKGIGSTKIYYRGNPTIKRRGGGKLIQVN